MAPYSARGCARARDLISNPMPPLTVSTHAWESTNLAPLFDLYRTISLIVLAFYTQALRTINCLLDLSVVVCFNCLMLTLVISGVWDLGGSYSSN